MSYNNSYESHLQMIDTLKQNLSTLSTYMENISEKYKRQIDVMESAGFVQNYITPLRGKYGEFSQKIEHIKSLIENHKTQIALHEEALRYLIEDARG